MELYEKKHRLSELLLIEKGLASPSAEVFRPSDSSKPACLSFAQQRLWFLNRVEANASLYNMPTVFRLHGTLDIALLESCLQHVTHRHAVLRTSFRQAAREPYQHVDEAACANCKIIDFEGIPADLRRDEAVQEAKGIAQQPFNLEKGPLWRTVLIRLSPRSFLFVVVMHHAISDDHSLKILWSELSELYTAQQEGRKAQLSRLTAQYTDFAYWQRELIKGHVGMQQLAFWKQHLRGAPFQLAVPTDSNRPSNPTRVAATCRLTVASSETNNLYALGLEHDASPFMTLLAVWTALLFRHTNQKDVLVGYPMSGRHHKEFENLIGLFVNPLILRTSISPETSFLELLKNVRHNCIEGYSHQDLPFERLVEEMRPKRGHSRVPLFQTWFNMTYATPQELSLPGVAVESIPLPSYSAKFDMTLYACQTRRELGLTLVYDAELFDSAHMEDLLDQYSLLLTQVTLKPDRSIGSISLRTARARSVLPNPRKALRLSGSNNDTVVTHFRRQAQRFPSHPAIVYGHMQLTYRELDVITDRIAIALYEQGIGLGDRIVILCSRNPSLVCALIGAFKVRAVASILDLKQPTPRLLAQMKAVAPRAVILTQELSLDHRQLSPYINSRPCKFHLYGQPFEWFHGVSLGNFDGRNTCIPTQENAAYVVFTSGSAGEPNAVQTQHRPLQHFMSWYTRRFQFSSSDRFGMLSGLSHDPLMRDIFAPLCTGGTLSIPSSKNMSSGRELCQWLSQQAITAIHLTPPMLRFATPPACKGQLQVCQVASLRHIFFGGDVLTHDDIRRLGYIAPHAAWFNSYGTTETPQAVAYKSGANEEALDYGRNPYASISIGRGIDDTQLVIANCIETPAGIGEIGEVCVRTPYLSEGYLNNRSLSSKHFLQDIWGQIPDVRVYRTGDLGRYRSNGEVELIGRKDRQIAIRGFRVEPGEIEAVLCNHAEVDEAAIVANKASDEETTLTAYVVSPHTVSLLSLRRFLRDFLPEHMIPAYFIQVSEMPKTSNGKIDYAALALASGKRIINRPHQSPRTQTEKMIADAWHKVLDVNEISVHDNFFDLGGHSLLVAKVAAILSQSPGVNVPYREFFVQTLGELAESCDAKLVDK